jgi:hypothetical protein
MISGLEDVSARITINATKYAMRGPEWVSYTKMSPCHLLSHVESDLRQFHQSTVRSPMLVEVTYVILSTVESMAQLFLSPEAPHFVSTRTLI